MASETVCGHPFGNKEAGAACLWPEFNCAAWLTHWFPYDIVVWNHEHQDQRWAIAINCLFRREHSAALSILRTNSNLKTLSRLNSSGTGTRRYWALNLKSSRSGGRPKDSYCYFPVVVSSELVNEFSPITNGIHVDFKSIGTPDNSKKFEWLPSGQRCS